MTHVIRTYSTEGSTALVPSCSPLVLLDGGAGKRDADSPRHARRAVCEEQQSSRRDVVTVLVCTFFVAAGLFCALVASNAVSASRMAEALSDLPAQEITVVSGDSVWGLASQHHVDGYSTSELAQWIAEKNSLNTSELRPGQSLLVPASS